MTDAEPIHNPFAPPLQTDSGPVDTDGPVVIERRRILVRSDSIALPRACIRTGATEDLIVRHRKLKARPLATNIVLTMAFTGLMALIISQIIPWVAGLVTLTTFVLAYALITFLTQYRVSVTWYISRSYRNRAWLMRLGGFLVLTFVFGFLGSVLTRNSTSPVIFMISFGAILGLGFHPERGMRLLNMKSGDAFVLKGHSGRFYDAIHSTK